MIIFAATRFKSRKWYAVNKKDRNGKDKFLKPLLITANCAPQTITPTIVSFTQLSSS